MHACLLRAARNREPSRRNNQFRSRGGPPPHLFSGQPQGNIPPSATGPPSTHHPHNRLATAAPPMPPPPIAYPASPPTPPSPPALPTRPSTSQPAGPARPPLAPMDECLRASHLQHQLRQTSRHRPSTTHRHQATTDECSPIPALTPSREPHLNIPPPRRPLTARGAPICTTSTRKSPPRGLQQRHGPMQPSGANAFR